MLAGSHMCDRNSLKFTVITGGDIIQHRSPELVDPIAPVISFPKDKQDPWGADLLLRVKIRVQFAHLGSSVYFAIL